MKTEVEVVVCSMLTVQVQVQAKDNGTVVSVVGGAFPASGTPGQVRGSTEGARRDTEGHGGCTEGHRRFMEIGH